MAQMIRRPAAEKREIIHLAEHSALSGSGVEVPKAPDYEVIQTAHRMYLHSGWRGGTAMLRKEDFAVIKALTSAAATRKTFLFSSGRTPRPSAQR